MNDQSLKRSRPISSGYWQYEFREDRLDVVHWDEPPTSTLQWVYVGKDIKDHSQFYLEGTNMEDIRVVPYGV